MKLILALVICCLALHNGKGAPTTAVYKFVRCNPEGDQANCVTQKSTEMAWSPDLPAKLPAATAQYLEAEPEEDGGESPTWEEEGVDEMEEEYDEGAEEGESPITGEEGESPVETEEGSGGYEGSGAEGSFLADWAFAPGSDEKPSGMRRLFPSRPVFGEAKPAEQELREDHLLL
ncbi:serglycin isoform X2 [Epinephelus fuscoguttatus]|uniref:serglycin isoform X2 n=1 Tax=Epinephelus fuscoguttatus TaxID=293821 RepID=UPI0020D0B872|nr:serglycin isoform X2 [Epinephelus fuscoguttatus]